MTEASIVSEVLKQGPSFAILAGVLWYFIKFLERNYSDHQNTITSLQETFKNSITEITHTIGSRLDRIEETLEGKKSTSKK